MKIDTLFLDADIYNVFIRRWIRQDVAVLGERILLTGNASDHDFEPELVVDCEGRPLIPGLIDIHLHIESSLCTPETFGHAVLPHGVTTVVSEPHEIANVFGLDGIEEMIRVSANSPIDIFYGVPSSVPSTSPQQETTGGIIRPEDAQTLFRNHPEVICLGEVMDFSSLTRMENGRTTDMIAAVRRSHPLAAIEGHCPSIRDLELAKVLYAGVTSDHCLQDPEGMIQRFKSGMFVELQEKSISDEIIKGLRDTDSEGLYCFVTDDVPPDILVKDGHLDFIIKKALKLGLPLGHAVTASSWAPACRMGLRDRGAVSPGKIADLLLLEDSSPNFQINRVFRKGREYQPDDRIADSRPSRIEFDDRFKASLRLNEDDVREDMFDLIAPGTSPGVRIRAMEKNPDNTYTRESAVELTVTNGLVNWEHSEGNLVIVMDRYTGDAGFSRGYMTGSCFHGAAVASSYAHDHHNLLAAGDNQKDLESAMKWVIRNQGGICLVAGGEVRASLSLPIGGILSEQPMEILSDELENISRAMRALGFEHRNPLMSFSTLTLPVSPEIKITDLGIFRTDNTSKLSLFLPG